MPQPTSTDRNTSWLLTAVTAATAFGLRLARIPNIYAVGGLGIYAGARLPLWLAWIPSLAVMAGTDLYLWEVRADPPFDPWVYVGFLGYVVIGRLLVRDRSAWRIGAAAVLGSVQFFLISNFGTWLTSHGISPPMYPPTFDGLIACYIAGLPFLGYTLIGDLGFTAAVFTAEAWLTERTAEPAAEEVRT
jgi:hypothetical protein